MKLKLTFYGALCSTSLFEINDITASSSDFGDQGDDDPNNAEDYGCGNMQFTRIPATEDVLKKYGITVKEYSEICDKLEAGLSFGRCGWCI